MSCQKKILNRKKMAMGYYEGTVFEVNSMSYIEPRTNEVDQKVKLSINDLFIKINI